MSHELLITQKHVNFHAVTFRKVEVDAVLFKHSFFRNKPE